MYIIAFPHYHCQLVEQVLAPLRGVGAVYTAECYDNSGGLLWESKSGAAGSNLSPT